MTDTMTKRHISIIIKDFHFATVSVIIISIKELILMTAKKLTIRQKILVAGTLFGMFFGAGNLIFPVHLGQLAGRNVRPP